MLGQSWTNFSAPAARVFRSHSHAADYYLVAVENIIRRRAVVAEYRAPPHARRRAHSPRPPLLADWLQQSGFGFLAGHPTRAQ